MIPRVYIAGPYTASTLDRRFENTQRAKEVGRAVMRAGCYPVVPHIAGINFEDVNDSYDYWIEVTSGDLQTCHACVMVPGWAESKGSRLEYVDCLDKDRPVFEAYEHEDGIGFPAAFFEWVEGACG